MLFYALVSASILTGVVWGLCTFSQSNLVRDTASTLLLWLIIGLAVGIGFASDIWWAIGTPFFSVFVVGNISVVIVGGVLRLGRPRPETEASNRHSDDDSLHNP